MSHIRITTKDIQQHIEYIEKYSNYKVIKIHDEKKPTYHVMKNNKIVSVIISNTNNDVYDMLEPYWMRAFINDCNRSKTNCECIKSKYEL